MNKKILAMVGISVLFVIAVSGITESAENYYYNSKCYADNESMNTAIKQVMWDNPAAYNTCFKICREAGFETVLKLDIENQICWCK